MTSALLRLRRPAITLLPFLAFGCATGNVTGGQTGEEGGTKACDETLTPLAEEEDSVLGFGADEVLAIASAKSAALDWLATNPPYGPESGMAELTLSLDPLGTAAFVESRQLTGDERYPCVDRVEVDVTVTLATSGGALAEQFQSKLRAIEASTAELHHYFDAGDVEGTLSFDAEALGNRRVTRIMFDASFGDGALSGALRAGIEQTSGDTVSFGELTIACFGGATVLCPQR